jgi:hypothetical protein
MQTTVLELAPTRESQRPEKPSTPLGTNNSRGFPRHAGHDEESARHNEVMLPFWMWFIENPRSRGVA